MKQICNQCHNDCIEEFDPCEIRSIMEEQHLCFKCAFWKWQKRLDVEVRPKEGVIPIIIQEYYKTVSCFNKQSHYVLHLGPNNMAYMSRGCNTVKDLFKHIPCGILTTDGYLYPYTYIGYSKDGGLSYQGAIPVNNKDFVTNAKFIQNQELYKLINSVHVKLELWDNTVPGVFRVKVDKEIVDKKFNL